MFEWTGDNNLEILAKIREHKAKVKKVVEQAFDENLDRKRMDELVSAGRFLLELDETARVVELRESPDFVIEFEGRRIGLENRVVRIVEEQKMVGSLENLMKAATMEFRERHPDLKIQSNVYMKRVWFPKKNWADAVEKIIDYTIAVHNEQDAKPPEFINKVFILPNGDGPVLRYNPGAYPQAELTEAALLEAIEEKNDLAQNYRDNTGIDEQWLLLVIGETGPASIELGELDFEAEIETSFARIYALEIFNNTVRRIF